MESLLQQQQQLDSFKIIKENNFENHSTNNFKLNLNQRSINTWNSFESDVLDTHLWLETFMLNVQTANNVRGKGQRLAVTELMKTPGRKRVGTNSTNTNTNTKKDPLATILFPIAPPLSQSKSLPIVSASRSTTPKLDKENQISLFNNNSRIPSPVVRNVFSPTAKGKGRAIMSPLRDSPRMIRPTTSNSNSNTSLTLEKVQIRLEVSPTKVMNTTAEELDDDEIESPTEDRSRLQELEDEKANLSIIGEEEECDESQSTTINVSITTNDNNNSSSTILPETQIQINKILSPSSNKIDLSSNSIISTSIPDDETAVPLNDAPSVRNPLSSSLPASSTNNNNIFNTNRTPGGTTTTTSNKFIPSSYSAHKPSTTISGITSSSPPQSHHSISSVMSNGTSTAGRPSNGNRLVGNTAGGGAPTLNFVGLSKKSLGLGMSFGRSLGGTTSTTGSSIENNSQGSQSNIIPNQSTSNSATTTTTTNSNNTTSTSTKRKSLTGPDVSNKISKSNDTVNANTEAAENTRRLLSRVQAMTAATNNQKRVSVANRQSYTSGSLVGVGGGKPLTSTISATTVQVSQPIVNTSASTTPVMTPLSPKPSISNFNPTLSNISNPFKPVHALAHQQIQQQQQQVAGSKPLPIPPTTTNNTTNNTTTNNNNTLPLQIRRHNSVTTLVNTFEQQIDEHIPTPSKLPISFLSPRSRSPLRSMMNTTNSTSGIARPISPNSNNTFNHQAPRTFMRSPTFKSGLSTTGTTNNLMSTTPKGSPMRKIDQFNSKSILQALEMAREVDEDKEDEIEIEELLIREVLPVTNTDKVVDVEEEDIEEESIEMEIEINEVEKLLREKEDLILSLPDILSDNNHDDQDEEEEGNNSEFEINNQIVEKGRGALAIALEIRSPPPPPIVQTASTISVVSPKKNLMPGSLMVEDEDEEEDEENADEDGNEADLSVEIIEVIKKVPTGLVRKASTVSMTGSRTSNATSSSTTTSHNGILSNSIYGNKSSMSSNNNNNGGTKVKSIQLAAAAAKKEQQEKERKLALKEEREMKRLALTQRKQEDERIKFEDERKIRVAEGEKKRKERDDLNNSQAGALKTKVVRPKILGGLKDRVEEGQAGKKRKVDSEIKRTEPIINNPKRPIPPPIRTAPPNSNLHASLNSSTGRSGLAPHHNNNNNNNKVGQNSNSSSMIGVKYMNNAPAFTGTGPLRPALVNKSNNAVGGPGPSTSATAAAQNNSNNNKPRPTQPKSEENYPELPDIESEYSDSGDEGYEEKAAARPSWAQSPNLAVALYRQAHVNPDDIFGPIPTLQMNEIFRTNSTRITKRTSSACWEGTDALTAADEANYNRQMGFQPRRPSTLRK